MSVSARLQRLERRLPRPQPQPPRLAMVLETGERFVWVHDEWVLWPEGQAWPRTCKVYGFDMRGL